MNSNINLEYKDNKTDIINKIYIHGIFFIFLTIITNFISSTLSCRLQYYLTKYHFLKYIVILGLIFFTINITNQNENISPFTQLGQSIIILIGFILFNRMEFFAFVIVLFSFISIIFINSWMNYNDKNMNKNMNKNIYNVLTNETLNHIKQILLIGSIIIMMIGVIFYLIRQKKEHRNFSYITFLLGNPICKKLI